MLVDTHCHLDMLEDLDGALERMRAAGVERAVTIGVDRASSEWAARAARTHADVWATVGLVLRPGPAGFVASFRNWFVSGLPFTVLVYAAVVGIVHSLNDRARLRIRERDAARLAQQLSEAQASSDVIDADNAVQLANVRLTHVIALDPSTTIVPADDVDTQRDFPSEDLTAMLKSASAILSNLPKTPRPSPIWVRATWDRSQTRTATPTPSTLTLARVPVAVTSPRRSVRRTAQAS